MEKTGAQIIMEVLLEQGVDTIFGYPGATVLAVYDALYDYSGKIRHILTAHEQGAAHAAEGYARASGKTGVCLATSGPGSTNLVTGIASAFMDSIPVVFITGNVDASLLGRDSFQEVDTTGITMPVTKHSFIVKRIEDLAHSLREAFRIAGSGRKGPVLVDIPKNITLASTDYTPQPAVCMTPPKPLRADCLERAVQAIRSARQPLLYIGGGVISSGASAELVTLAQRLDIPVASSMMGLGGFPADHPLYLGMIGMHGAYAANRAAQECDLLIAAGARFSDRVAGNRAQFAPKAKIIHMDIDPAEMDKNLFAEYHLRGDLKEIFRRLLTALPPMEHAAWRAQTASFRQPQPSEPEDGLPTPKQVIETLDRLTPDETQIVTDVGQHQMWTAQYYTFEKPRTFITSGGLGAMGFGLGAAIGASLANPACRTVLVSGDGSFHMNLNELATAVSYRLPIVDLVMNNTVLGMVRQWQTVFYHHRYAQTAPQRQTDLVRLAEAFGAKGLRIERAEQVEPVLRQALACGGPCVVDCRISPDAMVLPMIPPGGAVQDTINVFTESKEAF
ncbi:MAG TPA: biosynthetic-type acetolactate synthase large subunit [Candidatus Fimivicinus intestinavium]|nr:biosynthetic-type acetolactate synthase large subunit [Candidatus Fimivicinus intestinavium]